MNILASHRACGLLYRYLKTTYNGGTYIVPANVCHVVPMTFLSAGIPFTFVDIDKDTLCIDEKKCLELLGTGKYSGLIFVRTYGYLYDTANFFSQIKAISPASSIIDDRCLCEPGFGFINNGADMQLYSTGYAKYAELKYGAFALLKDENMYERMAGIENLTYDESVDIEDYVKSAEAKHAEIVISPQGWLNTALMTGPEFDDYKSNVLKEKSKAKGGKESINGIYSQHLGKFNVGERFNDWRYNICVSNKAEVLDAIFTAGYFASSHYRPICSLFGQNCETPVAEALHSRVINLFNDHYFSCEKARGICEIINKTAKL